MSAPDRFIEPLVFEEVDEEDVVDTASPDYVAGAEARLNDEPRDADKSASWLAGWDYADAEVLITEIDEELEAE